LSSGERRTDADLMVNGLVLDGAKSKPRDFAIKKSVYMTSRSLFHFFTFFNLCIVRLREEICGVQYQQRLPRKAKPHVTLLFFN
jgi:hypothetical protein